MLGILFALMSAVSGGVEKIIHRHILTKEDTLSYAFIWQLVAALFLLPLFFIEFGMPANNNAWFLVLISGIMWTVIAYVGFAAYSNLEVSLKTSISKSKLFFILLFSIIFLREVFSAEKLIGTVLIFTGILIATHKRGQGFKKLKSKGALLALLAAFLGSIAMLIDKYAMNFFNPGMYTFMLYLMPAIFLSFFVIKRGGKIKSILRNRLAPFLISAIAGGMYYYLIVRAFKVAEASVVVPIVELSVLVSVLGGIILLKERENLWNKIIGAVVVISGTIILAMI